MTKRSTRSPVRTALALVAIAASLGAFALSRLPWQRAGLPPRDGPAITSAKAWGYQLQKLDPRRVPDHVDILVTDYSRDGTNEAVLTIEDIRRLQRRRDGSRRIVLSYLSIGEAETYRYYWMPTWRFMRPRWLGDENPEWKGNYPVRYWLSDWQSVIVKPDPTRLDWLAERILPWRMPYLDRIIDAGFDGVYLDRVDVYAEFEDKRRSARRDMIAFVERIAAYARARRPGFLIVPQNGEELLSNRGYVAAIDAIAKEDLLFGAHDERKPNSEREVAEAVASLDRVTAAGKPVLMVEYVDDPAQQAKALVTAREKGYLPLFARRALDRVPEKVPELPPPVPPSGPSGPLTSPGTAPSAAPAAPPLRPAAGPPPPR
jgi:cysteinyl-tRNA synthetase